MQLFVRSLVGETRLVDVNDSDNVWMLKEKLEVKNRCIEAFV